jgi:hypothetical protein
MERKPVQEDSLSLLTNKSQLRHASAGIRGYPALPGRRPVAKTA